MTVMHITIGSFEFTAQMEETDAPETCNAIRQLVPLQARIIQAAWCGEALWIQLNSKHVLLPGENETSLPNSGEILFYADPSGAAGFLFPYGNASFKSKHGRLSGNHCLTVISGDRAFQALGNTVLWEGAQNVRFDLDHDNR